LQTLGLVPRELSEEKVRRAIAADDDEAYKIAQSMPYESMQEYACGAPRGVV
jgi:hypothetical protein